MKKIICSMAAAFCLVTGVSADEGMWLLPLIQKMNASAMKDLGCRLSSEDIYSINQSSLKDAIVQFGGGCTGELISGQGLLVTNHHCGYSSIQRLSSDEHNYLENGYWAMDRSQELPVPGLTVSFLVGMTDVTDEVNDAIQRFDTAFADSSDAAGKASLALRSWMREYESGELAGHPGCRARVQSFYNDNVYYLILYKTYRDIRFVGAPPVSVGKFGGETDNWMWPRHTGDFSMFRVYAGADNQPADYSESNVPYTPARSLKISLKGIREGDFSMILGYPGRTQRFQTEVQLEQMMSLHDISIAARTIRQEIMWKYMDSDPSIRLKYADKYAGSSNGWKKWIGEKKAFEDLDIIGRERRKEAAFHRWILKNKKRTEKYGTALQDVADGIACNSASARALRLLGETLLNVELLDLSNRFAGAFNDAVQEKDSAAAFDVAYSEYLKEYRNYCEPLDREVSAAMLKHYREKADPADYPDVGEDFATLDIDRFVKDLFDRSVFTSPEKLKNALSGGIRSLQGDPVPQFLQAIYQVMAGLQSRHDPDGDRKVAEGSKAFTEGLLEWNKGKASYPDANFTMRLTYGSVKSYSPKDALNYRYYTTIYGIIEKADPGKYEFRVPSGLIDLYHKRDYGPYAMPDGNLPVCFLTNNDITGGNSGSPVLNADGELIGLAFDGNWESMSSDVMFEPDLQRCICVDIRYVLFLMDKLGGAGYLLKELDIVR